MFPNRTILFIGGITKSISKCKMIYLNFFIADIVIYFSKYCDILDCVVTIDNTKSILHFLIFRSSRLLLHHSSK